MKDDYNKKYINVAIYTFIVVVAVSLFILFLIGARDFFINKQYTGIFIILRPFIYGFVFAYLLNPLLNFFENKIFYKIGLKHRDLNKGFKLRRKLSLITTFIIAFIIIIMVALMVFPQIGSSINQLKDKTLDLFTPSGEIVTDNPLMSSKFGVYVSNSATWLQNFFEELGFDLDVEQAARDMLPEFTYNITGFIRQYYEVIFNATTSLIYSTVMQLLSIALNFIIGIIVSLHFLNDKEKFIAQIKRLLYSFFPVGFANKIIEIIRKTHKTFGGFIIGKAMDSAVIGIICFIFMYITGMEYIALISVIVGITNMIPFFGPFIGAIPSIFFLGINDLKQAVVFAIFILILQQIDGNIIGPKIIGSSVKMSSFWILFAIIVMNALFGVFGMFVGVPIFAVIYTLLTDFTSMLLRKKGMPTETEEYLNNKSSEDTDVVDKSSKESEQKGFAAQIEKLSKSIYGKIFKNSHNKPHDDDYDDE